MTNSSIRKLVENTRGQMTDRRPGKISDYNIMCELGLLSRKFPAYDISYIGLIKNQVRAYNHWFAKTLRFGIIPACIRDESMVGEAIYSAYQNIRNESDDESDEIAPSDDLVMMEYARIYNKKFKRIHKEEF